MFLEENPRGRCPSREAIALGDSPSGLREALDYAGVVGHLGTFLVFILGGCFKLVGMA